MRATVVLVMATCLLGCASARLKGEPGLDVIVKADPRVISPDAAGASRIAEASRCEVEAIRPVSSGAYLFRLWPTALGKDVQECLRIIRTLPGVEYALPNVDMKHH